MYLDHRTERGAKEGDGVNCAGDADGVNGDDAIHGVNQDVGARGSVSRNRREGGGNRTDNKSFDGSTSTCSTAVEQRS